MTRSRDRSRTYDVVLWGATGFTGSLVAEYLAQQLADSGLRMALGGRNRQKLETVRNGLATRHPAAADLPILLADSRDEKALADIARQAEVVCTTVGPYAKYGHELVAACVEEGTDYCDLTGEVHFIRAMVDRHHERARATGARIVHCCGFDSIPSDLGTLMVNRAMADRHDARLDEVKLVVGPMRGGFSGGTVASMLNIIEEAGRDRSIRKILGHPYALNPEGQRMGPDGSDLMKPRFDRKLGRWTGPFVMAGINTRVVRRSNALLGWPYGRDFRYSEVMGFRAGLKGRLSATTAAGGLGLFVGALDWAPTRAMLKKTVLPSPGEGPDREKREKGFFKIRLHARGQTEDGETIHLTGRVEGHSDPGYGETAKMLGQSALCLALDGPDLESPGGILTPASAMGMRLVERLRAAGMVFEVE